MAVKYSRPKQIQVTQNNGTRRREIEYGQIPDHVFLYDPYYTFYLFNTRNVISDEYGGKREESNIW